MSFRRRVLRLIPSFSAARVRFPLHSFKALVISSFSIIIESVKILMSDSSQISPVQKGDAILKLVVGFVSGILGNYVIDSLLESCGIPDPFSDIVAAISSAVIGGLVMQIYTKLDIFGMQKELRRQRIEEFFKLRREALADAGANLNMVVSQQLKIKRKNLELIKSKLSQAINDHDFEMMDDAAAQACEFFNIEVPYNTPEEFLKFLEKNNYKILIV